jgi:diguanylate cyclase (GGDEF)-like protein
MEKRPSRSAEAGGFFTALHRLLRGRRASLADGSVTQPTAIDSEIEQRLRGNERIWAGFREIEIRMLAAGTLHAVIAVLSRDVPKFFPGVDAVSVAWLDPDYEATHLLEQEGGAAANAFVALHPPISGADTPQVPSLGALDLASQQRLFPHIGHPLRSFATVPLVLRGERVGSLNQGSADPLHFTPGTATDFLEHLAAVTAICIDNAVNRARLQRDGLTDMLTEVANRRFFDRRLRDEISQWQRRGADLSCLLVDLDRFKLINDHHGHQAGDLVLQEVARTLSKGLRESDVLARYGGEEFVLLLPATGSERAAEIAERLRAAVAGLVILVAPGVRLQVTASFGLASLAGGARVTLDDPGLWLLRQADQALYAAKARGRNRVATLGESNAEATAPPLIV